MNITFIYDIIHPEHGGIGRVTCALSDYFKIHGHGVSYFLAEDSGYPLEKKHVIRSGNFSLTKENKEEFFNFLKAEKCDVVINQAGWGKTTSRLAYCAHAIGIPIVSVFHNTLLDIPRNYWETHEYYFNKIGLYFLKPFIGSKFGRRIAVELYKLKHSKHIRETAEKSTRVVLLSDSFKSDFSEYLDCKNIPENICAIPNPMPFLDVSSPKKKKTIIWCGRVNFSQKRIDLILDIWKRISEYAKDWELKIVGGGDELDEAKNLAEKMRLERISFEGFQNPKKYYEEAEILCMTSAYEGWGMVLVEASAYGCVPVVFDSYASAKDVIRDGINGILVPAFDKQAYAAAVLRLIRNEHERKRLSASAKENADSFSLEHIGEKWLQMLETIIFKNKKY